MLKELDKIYNQFCQKLENFESKQELEQIKTLYLGKKSPLLDILKNLKNLPPEQKGEVGQYANQTKQNITKNIQRQFEKLVQQELEKKIQEEWLDVTYDGEIPSHIGGLHPVSIIQQELEDMFTSLGFSILDGPHIETDFYNFEALNIPVDHPARDMQDTFYFTNGAILRTHTSAVQVRGMQEIKPPFKIIAPGKVFRVERPDATHESAFHQMEGMVVGKDINVAQLIGTMKMLLAKILKRKVQIRLRPGFFPFVEPGFELDIACQLCNQKGCKVCKNVGWIELIPCGMVHPNVLRAGGIDPKIYSGFAFGLGLDRLVMMRYKIEDIRHLHSGDLRFSQQFS